ncbi:MAG: TrmH family RNA methyltransferase [Saprospiraceae bacterium]|jgi:TrmH family RNA methyltransferase
MVSNSTIKLIQSLKLKKYRQKYNLFVVEGWKSITTVLSQKEIIVERIFTSNPIDLKAYAQFPEIIATKPSEIKKLSHLQSPTDAVALVKLHEANKKEVDYAKPMIYLDDIQDPGNLGTIIRIADWYGFGSILRSQGSADFYSPKAIQSSMGSFANLHLSTLDKTDLLEQEEIQLVITSLHGSSSLDTLIIDQPICLVIGNEGKGVSQTLMDSATIKYTIEGSPNRKAESLNAAVATGIMCEKIYGLKAIG